MVETFGFVLLSKFSHFTHALYAWVNNIIMLQFH